MCVCVQANQTSVALNQIELDLLRTLPSNKYYNSADASGVSHPSPSSQPHTITPSHPHPITPSHPDQQAAASAGGFLVVRPSGRLLPGTQPTGSHCSPLSGGRRHLLVSGSHCAPPPSPRLLQLYPAGLHDRPAGAQGYSQGEIAEAHRASRSVRVSGEGRGGEGVIVRFFVSSIDFQLITFNWFHTIYVDNLPVEVSRELKQYPHTPSHHHTPSLPPSLPPPSSQTMLRIWDTFLYEGSKVLFRFAVAIFRYNEEALMASESSIGVFNRLRTMCQDATDIDKLVQVSV